MSNFEIEFEEYYDEEDAEEDVILEIGDVPGEGEVEQDWSRQQEEQ